MRSSTSSSNIDQDIRTVPPGRWLWAVVGAVAFLVVFVAFMELRLAKRGFDATVVDSDALWLKQRARASELGERALILVGASRMQLDLDLDVLTEKSGFIPVQLAVDGSSFMPILDELSQDPSITGTLLVGYQDNDVNIADTNDRAVHLAVEWQQHGTHRHLPDFQTAETFLSDNLRHKLRSYADGARPITSLLLRVMDHSATPQYLETLPDRSRIADYQRVAMPSFYYSRVVRNLGDDVPLKEGMSWIELNAEIQLRIDALKPTEKIAFDRNSHQIATMVKLIEKRGGKVIFIVMPRSGMVLDIDNKRFPRAIFWNNFVAQTKSASINVENYPELSKFQCPDGSHLDSRDRSNFTAALIEVMNSLRSR